MKVIELVQYQSRASQAQMQQLNEHVDQFCQTQEGFIQRHVCYDQETQYWYDIVFWQSLQHAQAASQAIQHLGCMQDFMTYLVEDTLIMKHLNQISELNA